MVDKEKIKVNQSLCLNTRCSEAACDYCQKICPSSGIEYRDTSIEINHDVCIDCGLCIVACPSEVFSLKDNQARDLIRKVASLSDPSSIQIICPNTIRQTDEDGTMIFYNRCLGSLTPGELLEIAYNHEVLIRVDYCKDCEISTGADILKKNIHLANNWLRGLSNEEKAPISNSFFNQEQDVLTKTTFLKQASEEMQIGFAGQGSILFSALKPSKKSIGEAKKSRQKTVKQHLPKWRERMKNFWASTASASELQTVWPSVGVDKKKCLTCLTCYQYCPSEALTFTSDDGTFVGSHIPGFCIDCGLCAIVCKGEALSRGYAEIKNPFCNKDIVVVDIMACASCKAPTRPSEVNLCYWCKSQPNQNLVRDYFRKKLLSGATN